MYGAKISTIRPTPGMVTPAIIGWNIVSSSCRPRKYHGAFDGFGVWLVLASCSSGALTKIEKTNVNARHTSEATNSAASRCGQVCTLSTGEALTSWIEPLLTTVSRRWVCPPGPAPTGTPPPVGAACDDRARRGRRRRRRRRRPAPARRPPPPALAPWRRATRSSRWAGMRGLGRRRGGVAGRLARPAAAGAAAASSAAALSRAACARLRRCSGISVMARLLGWSQRTARCRRPCGLARSGWP